MAAAFLRMRISSYNEWGKHSCVYPKNPKVNDTLMFVLNLQAPFWQAEVHLPLSLVKLQVLLHPFRGIGSMHMMKKTALS